MRETRCPTLSGRLGGARGPSRHPLQEGRMELGLKIRGRRQRVLHWRPNSPRLTRRCRLLRAALQRCRLRGINLSELLVQARRRQVRHRPTKPSRPSLPNVTASNVCLVISMYVCLYLVQTVRSDAAGFGAKRCGAERRIRSGAMTMRRSVASTNAIQKCLPFNKRVIIFDHFGAQRFRPTCRFRPVLISGYLTCY